MKIIIPGNPIPKARARHSNRGKYVITYDPQEKDKFRVKEILTSLLQEGLNSTDKNISKQWSELCLGRVFKIIFWFYLPINKSDSIATRNAKLWDIEPATCKPDYDNLEKFYLDCANEVLFPDDRMIVDAHAHKRFDDDPRVEITIDVKELNQLTEIEKKTLMCLSPVDVDSIIRDMRLLIRNAETISGTQFIAQELNEFACKYSSIFAKIKNCGNAKKSSNKCKKLIEEIKDGRHDITRV